MSAQHKPARPEIMPLAPENLPLASVPDGVEFPPDSIVWMAFDDSREGLDKIVGRTSLIPFLMIEGSWVHPDYKGSTLAVRLVRTVENKMSELGHSHLMAFSNDDEISDYLRRFGYVEQPFKVFVKEIKPIEIASVLEEGK